MNTITNNAYNLYTQNTSQVSSTQDQSSVHRHHHDDTQSQSTDSVQLSQAGLQASSVTPTSVLDSLVSTGTITQDQENAIQSAFQSSRQAAVSGTYGSQPTNPISSLVSAGTITQDQAAAIASAFKSAMQSSVSGISNSTQIDPLSSLVSAGTITQDQAAAVKSAFQSTMQSNVTGVSSSTQTDPLSSLVSAGTITQDQADAIQSAIQSSVQANQDTQQVSGTSDQTTVHHHHHAQQTQDAIQSDQTSTQQTPSSLLDSLVSNGTITQDQENTIENDLESLLQNNQ